MKTTAEIIQTASPEAKSVIEEVLKIHREGRHYRELPKDLEQDYCDRIIRVIKDQVRV